MSSDPRWFTFNVNPDPWAIGPLGVGRKQGGKLYPYVGANAQLVAYQEAIRELLVEAEKLPPGQYKFTFYFWRRLESHASGRKHYADATNLVKACEDALQGAIIENDRFVRDVRGVIVEQEPDTKPFVALKAEMWDVFDPHELPDFIWQRFDEDEQPTLDNDNTWPPS